MKILILKCRKIILKFIANHPIFMGISLLTIPFLGFYLSIQNWDGAFPRSGALLVSFAIALVYINHFITEKIELSDAQKEFIKVAQSSPKVNQLKELIDQVKTN